MPLVGDMKAAGETPSALKAVIKTRLADFVKLQGRATRSTCPDRRTPRALIAYIGDGDNRGDILGMRPHYR